MKDGPSVPVLGRRERLLKNIANLAVRLVYRSVEVRQRAGETATWITQKAVELLGPLGYSRDWLVEKWMRDGKINDIYEGTGQINTLVVARQILGYSRHQLK